MSTTDRRVHEPAAPVPALDYDVVIPTQGRSDYVFDALESVWSQSFPPTSVIVVVDGPLTDLAHRIKVAYPESQVIVLSESRGAACARAAGVTACRSTWVAYLDDDDLWHHRKQEECARYIHDHPQCRALRTQFWLFSDTQDGPTQAFGLARELVADNRVALEQSAATVTPVNDLSYLDIHGDSFRLMMERNRGVTSATLVQRSLLAELPPLPEVRATGSDWLLFIHVAARTEWSLVADRLLFIRLHRTQMTRDPQQVAPTKIYDAMRHAWGHYQDDPRIDIRSYGKVYATSLRVWMWDRIRNGELRAARQLYSEARPFIPKRTDRARAMLPPPVAWHTKAIIHRTRRRLRRRRC